MQYYFDRVGIPGRFNLKKLNRSSNYACQSEKVLFNSLLTRVSDCTLMLAEKYLITGLARSLRLQEVQTCRITRKLAHGSGRVIRPIHRPSLLCSFLLEADFYPRVKVRRARLNQ
jgi:hypothetical protein